MGADDALVLPVPPALSATYLVPTTRPPADPAGEAAARLDGLLSGAVLDLARQMLAGPLMSVRTVTVGELPPLPTELLVAFGLAVAIFFAVEGLKAIRNRLDPDED